MQESRRSGLSTRRPPALIDVRERQEYEQGYIPGAIHIPRGFLESRIERNVLERSTPVVVYCASGERSVYAAKTLQDLGYTDVVSMKGGFSGWKDNGREWKVPHALTPEQFDRYSRHVLIPEVGEEGQLKLLDSKVLPDRRGRARLAGRRLPGSRRRRHASASSTPTPWTCPTSSARSSTRSIAWA